MPSIRANSELHLSSPMAMNFAEGEFEQAQWEFVRLRLELTIGRMSRCAERQRRVVDSLDGDERDTAELALSAFADAVRDFERDHRAVMRKLAFIEHVKHKAHEAL